MTAYGDDLRSRVRADGDANMRREVERLRAANRALIEERDAAVDRQTVVDAEVERLTRWKAEATLVLEQWDEVYLSLDRPWNLGESKAQGAQVAVEALLSTNRRLTAENERLERAVEAVRDLHMPVVDGRLAMRTDADGWCDSDKENYPCPTIRALDAALDGERDE